MNFDVSKFWMLDQISVYETPSPEENCKGMARRHGHFILLTTTNCHVLSIKGPLRPKTIKLAMACWNFFIEKNYDQIFLKIKLLLHFWDQQYFLWQACLGADHKWCQPKMRVSRHPLPPFFSPWQHFLNHPLPPLSALSAFAQYIQGHCLYK